jgi:hypothetical protein
MNMNMPVVGTRFKYCRNKNAHPRWDPAGGTTEEPWEGVVVRTCDAWTPQPAVELQRLDTGDLWHMKLYWWEALTQPSKETVDHIVIISVPEEE